MISEGDEAAAGAVLNSYRQSTPHFCERPEDACAKCGSEDTHDDPQPRRNLFIAWFICSIAGVYFLLATKPTQLDLFYTFVAQIVFWIVGSWLLIRYFKWRYRCDTCGHRWREERHLSYSTLSRAHAGAFGPPD